MGSKKQILAPKLNIYEETVDVQNDIEEQESKLSSDKTTANYYKPFQMFSR